jgi:hypothetical protein
VNSLGPDDSPKRCAAVCDRSLRDLGYASDSGRSVRHGRAVAVPGVEPVDTKPSKQREPVGAVDVDARPAIQQKGRW